MAVAFQPPRDRCVRMTGHLCTLPSIWYSVCCLGAFFFQANSSVSDPE